ncbi:MAG: hypothetical protein Pg6C_18460 [Treponemataceae bacterium]|nr:MAG: hypothetical protein Pg6C_18460 [Treponemataceae bacterium]
MALEKWKASSVQTKIGSAAVALAAVLRIGYVVFLCFIFVYFKDRYRMTGMFYGEVEMNVEILLAFAGLVIELALVAGLFLVKRWAWKNMLGWGVFSLITLVWSFVYNETPMPTALLLAEVLDIAAATALLFAKKDFAEK